VNEPDFATIQAGSHPEHAIAPLWSFGFRFAKRTFDVLAAATGLLLLCPVLVIAAIAVKLGSRGPVLFVQQRMGRNFRPFGIYKFRTMVTDAERVGGQITFGRDPRITRVGHVLRQTKLDELPQLLNVLLGQMSLVGPRPEVPRYVELYRQDYEYVLAIRPGITDLASLKYRDEAEQLARSADPAKEYAERILPDKIALAREYIDTATFRGDLSIIFRTFVRIAR
jgi:lipopolysaccharide/colanic/teichoic acid biosynthesis glycosyltransferase